MLQAVWRAAAASRLAVSGVAARRGSLGISAALRQSAVPSFGGCGGLGGEICGVARWGHATRSLSVACRGAAAQQVGDKVAVEAVLRTVLGRGATAVEVGGVEIDFTASSVLKKRRRAMNKHKRRKRKRKQRFKNENRKR